MNRRRLPQDSDDTGSWRKLHFRLRGGHGGLVEAGTSRSDAVQMNSERIFHQGLGHAPAPSTGSARVSGW
jgi:hypothetical protein